MIKWRIGQFFIFLALIILVVFLITNQVESPEFLYLCSGMAFLILGGYLMWRGRNPTPPSAERFRTIRRISERGQKKGEQEVKEE
ncbi:MAG: hypothetical protein PVF74_09160 [Anaerolineales bacterium]|jgi:hypothetical protein